MDLLNQSVATVRSENGEIPLAIEKAILAIAQLLLEALPLSAIVINPAGQIAFVNQQAEMLLGWGSPALEGQSAHEVLQCHFKDGAHTAEDCPITMVLSGESMVPSAGQMKVRCRDQSFTPVEYRCVQYPMLEGLGAVLAFRDLSRQNEMEKDLRRLASIAEESPIAIVELNEDANLIYGNPAMMSLVERFGFSSAARPLILPANIAKLTAKCLDTQKEVAGIDVSVGGSHYEWKLVPVMREGLVRGYVIDLTARKRAEIELTLAKAKAEVASQAKSKFLANMSEEIRVPIGDILSSIDLLAESGLNDQQIEHAKAIQSRTKSLLTSIDDILAMAALEAKNIRVEKTHFNFRTFMGKTAAAFIPRAEEKCVQLTVTIGNQVPAEVYCDPNRLGQLLHNLLSNAIKFTERGEVVVEVDRDTISTRPAGRGETDDDFFLFFTIRDTGIGIPREQLEAMLDRFAPTDGSSNSADEQTGWGLAVAKHLVELMGGTIGIESAPGKGSKFWFSLPMQQAVRRTGENNGGNKGRRLVI
ncbi:MAG TPA: ATP-binding protein [Methylomirabilota bacterium]|nr:ATP-binding protein [Methylomirabilota bacterium]